MEEKTRHCTPSFALMIVPHPADRETRMRPATASWIARNEKGEMDHA